MNVTTDTIKSVKAPGSLRHRLCCALLAALLALGSAQTAVRAADRALLIGINKYQDDRINDLRGCENDAEALRRVLIDDYGFAQGDIRLLRSTQATRAGILDAIDQFLIAESKPGDRVLFAYSGHGSQKKCPVGKTGEPDGYDEIFCPADYNPQTQANCILDDELNERLGRLSGRNVIVIVDACHSGSITKDIGGRFRSVETIDTAQSVPKYIPPPGGGSFKDIFFRPPQRFAADSASHQGVGQLRSSDADAATATTGAEQIIDELRANYIALTSCADAQTSEEIRVRVGSRYARRGAFTWLLCEGLAGRADKNRDGRITYREILSHVDQRLRDPRYDLTQTPVLRTRGAFFDQPFLGRILSSKGRPKVVAVSDDRITINRGAQQGISEAEVFASASAPKEGAVRIDSVEQFLATGRATGGLALHPGDVLQEKDITFTPGDLRVAVLAAGGVGGGDEIIDRLKTRIRRIDGITLVNDPSTADRMVCVARANGRLTASIYSRYGTLRSRTGARNDGAGLAEQVVRRLTGELLIQQLAQLENPGGDIDLHFSVVGERTSFVAYEDESRQETIRFEFQASQGCYLTLISIDSVGEVRTDLLRAGFQARAGERYTLPPRSEDPLAVFPPAGRDVIYVLATRRPLPARGLDTRSVHEKGTAAAIDEITRAIGRKTRPAAGPSLSEVAQLAREGWATARVTVDTLPEERN